MELRLKWKRLTWAAATAVTAVTHTSPPITVFTTLAPRAGRPCRSLGWYGWTDAGLVWRQDARRAGGVFKTPHRQAVASRRPQPTGHRSDANHRQVRGITRLSSGSNFSVCVCCVRVHKPPKNAALISFSVWSFFETVKYHREKKSYLQTEKQRKMQQMQTKKTCRRTKRCIIQSLQGKYSKPAGGAFGEMFWREGVAEQCDFWLYGVPVSDINQCVSSLSCFTNSSPCRSEVLPLQWLIYATIFISFNCMFFWFSSVVFCIAFLFAAHIYIFFVSFIFHLHHNCFGSCSCEHHFYTCSCFLQLRCLRQLYWVWPLSATIFLW